LAGSPALSATWLPLSSSRPVRHREQDTLPAQLAELGYAPRDVSTAILSHLHRDHIGGLPPSTPSRSTSATFWASSARPPHRGRRPDPAARPDPLAGGCSSFPWHPCSVAGGEDSTCHVQFRVTPGVPHHQVIRSPMAYSARPDAIATGPRGKNDDDHRNRPSSDRGLCRRDGNRLPLPRLGRSDDRRRRRAAVGAGLPSAGTRPGTFSHRPRAGPARARRERPSGR
jgi:hypothetical protein